MGTTERQELAEKEIMVNRRINLQQLTSNCLFHDKNPVARKISKDCTADRVYKRSTTARFGVTFTTSRFPVAAPCPDSCNASLSHLPNSN
jgi:hypothetical protein